MKSPEGKKELTFIYKAGRRLTHTELDEMAKRDKAECRGKNDIFKGK